MPVLGGPHKNANLGFYSTGFVNKILSGSTSSSLTKIIGYQCLTTVQFLDGESTISSPSNPDPPYFMLTLRPQVEVATVT